MSGGTRGPSVQVALPIPVRGTFTYAVPAGQPVPGPGCRVRVPFARTHHIGIVVEDPGSAPPETLRPLEEVLDRSPLLPPDILALTRWIADYYLVSWGSVLHCAYPSGLDPSARSSYEWVPGGDLPDGHTLGPLAEALRGGPRSLATLRALLGPSATLWVQEAVRQELVIEHTQWTARRRYAGQDRVALLIPPDEARAMASDPGQPKFFAKALSALLDFEQRGFPTVSQVAHAAKVPQHVLSEMAEAGWVELFDLLTARLPGRASPHVLNGAQEEAVGAVRDSLREARHRAFLLFGVTGSG